MAELTAGAEAIIIEKTGKLAGTGKRKKKMSLGTKKKAEKSLRSILIYIFALLFGTACYKGAVWAHSQKAGGVLLGLTALFAFYGFCVLAVKASRGFDLLRKLPPKTWTSILLWVMGTNVFFYFEMIREKKVYYWDASTYWQKTTEAAQQLFQSPGQLAHAVLQSVNDNDYNMIIPFLLALPTKIFGTAHITHVLLILNLFLIPAVFVIALTAKQAGGERALSLPFLFGGALLLPAFTFPVVAGYLDAFSLLTLALAFELVLTADFSSFDWYWSCLLAGAFLLSVLGRRYFAYPLVGIVAACCIAFLLHFVQKRPGWKTVLQFAANFLLTGAICFAVCFLFFRPFLLRAVGGSYAQKYSAYQDGSALADWKMFALYFGALILFVCLLGVIADIAAKRPVYPVFLLTALAVTGLLFYRVQSMDAHHYYIVAIPVFLLFADAACAFRTGSPAGKKAVAWAALSVLCLNFFTTYVYTATSPLRPLVSSVAHRPEERSDLRTVNGMAEHLKELSGKNGSARIYLLSSSGVMNYSVLQNIDAPDSFRFLPTLYSTSEVDLRDGFPYAFLQAGIVVVCEPTQYCVKPDGQRVVGILADDVLHNREISAHFRPDERYRLKGGVTAEVFLKKSQFTKADLKLIQDQFNGFYPAWHLNLQKYAAVK